MDHKALIKLFADLEVPVDIDPIALKLRWVILESRALLALMEGR